MLEIGVARTPNYSLVPKKPICNRRCPKENNIYCRITTVPKKIKAIILEVGILNAGRSRLQILYSSRDYRSEGSSGSEWKEVSVKPHTEVLFQPLPSKKARKFKLSSVVSMTLSA